MTAAIRIQLAANEWRAGTVAAMTRILDDQPKDLREWEWQYLKQQCRPERSEFRGQGCSQALFTPDGKQLITLNELVSRRDPETGKVIGKPEKAEGGEDRVLSDNAQWYAGAGQDRVVVQPVGLEKRPTVLRAPGKAMKRVAVSDTGDRVVTHDGDGDLILWDVKAGKPLRTVARNKWIQCVGLSRDGRWVAAGEFGKVYTWDMQGSTAGPTLELPRSYVHGMAFSPDSKRLACASGSEFGTSIGGLTVLNLENGGKQFYHGHTGWVRCTAFSADGRLLAAGTDNGSIRIWDVETGAERRHLRGYTAKVISVAFSPDGQQLVAVDQLGAVRLWAVQGDPERRTLSGGGRRTPTFSRDGKRMIWGGSEWDPRTGQKKALGDVLWEPDWIGAFSPEDRWLALGSPTEVVLLDGKTYRRSTELERAKESALAVGFVQGGRVLVAVGATALRAWDVSSGKLVHQEQIEKVQLVNAAFGPDDRLAATTDRSQLLLWDTATWKQLFASPETDSATRVAFGPQGQFATAYASMLQLRDPDTGKVLREWQGHPDFTAGLAFSPSGKRLAVVSYSGNATEVTVWDPATEQELLTLRNAGIAVCFDPTGTLLTTVHFGFSQMFIWDASGQR
jgi:WD40 repeat protein